MNASISNAASAYANIARLGGQLASGEESGGSSGAAAAGGPSFGQLVGHALNQAMATEYKSEATSVKAMAGKAELHEMVTAVANAELTLNTVVAIRDKVLGAYQEILKMPI